MTGYNLSMRWQKSPLVQRVVNGRPPEQVKTALLFLAGTCFALSSAAFSFANELAVGYFSSSNLESWENKSFSGKTTYSLVRLQDAVVLKAESHGSASGLFKEIKVDLTKYPYLNWRWRIESRLTTSNEHIKSGDDYAARIYVIIDGGFLPWRTRAVNYVWASKAEKYEVWPSAFAGSNSMMVALRNDQDSTATWYHEKRNVLEDLHAVFGREYTSIDGIAIMTDTDNNLDHTIAYYGDISFSAN